MAETKIIYHLDDQDTPYLVKLALPAECVTLLDLKNALNRPNYKYFFKSMDDDFGVVKEEIIDDNAVLPSFNGRIVTWLMSVDNSAASETQPQETSIDDVLGDRNHQPKEEPPTTASTKHMLKNQKSNTDSRKGPSISAASQRDTHPRRQYNHNRSHHRKPTSSVMTSDIETTSFVDSEDDVSTRVSTTTDTTNASSYYHRHQRRSRRKMRHPVLSQASSFSSVTDSTMSLNIITVMLNMEASSFLGISIVGQTSKGGDGGIYVGSIMKGGVVAQDGRIEPGDMLLEVNGTSFENMNNDEAVRTLRQAVQGPGPITLVLAKCWDPNPKGYFTIPRQEPAKPIDPSAWVLHTQAMQGMWRTAGPPSVSSVTSSSSSIISSIPENQFVHKVKRSSGTSSSSYSSHSYGELNKNTDMATIVRAMARPDSGLEVRDRTWLKITIKQSFIGSDLVDWLYTRVSGFTDRRDARRYACNLLKAGFIQHTVNKVTFSEQCYYVFGNTMFTDMANLSMNDIDSVSSVGDHDCKTRAFDPLPPMQRIEPYSSRLQSPGHLADPAAMSYSLPPSAPYNFVADTNSYISMPGMNGAESIVSGSAMRDQTCACIVTHTYKQFRKLWDNSDKSNPGQNAVKMLGKFDPDIDRSTSSDTGSSDSEGNNRPKRTSKNRDVASGSGICNRPQHQPSTDKMPPPGQEDADAGRVAIINSHAEEVVKEMGDL